MPKRIRAGPKDNLLNFLAENSAAMEAIRAKHKMEVKDLAYFRNKTVTTGTKAATWIWKKGTLLVTTNYVAWFKEKMRKKTEAEKEQKKLRKLASRADSDRVMRRYYIGRDVQGTIVCKQVTFEPGCEMTSFAEKIRDAEELFKYLPAFPDLEITVKPADPVAAKAMIEEEERAVAEEKARLAEALAEAEGTKQADSSTTTAATAASSTTDSSSSTTDSTAAASSTSDSTASTAKSTSAEAPKPDERTPEELVVAVKRILGEEWEVRYDERADGFRVVKVDAQDFGEDDIIKFNEDDFKVVVKDNCTPKQLAEFLKTEATRVEAVQKAHAAICEAVSEKVSPLVESLGLDDIRYNLKSGEETSGDVLGIANQFKAQTIFYRRHLQGLRVRISSKTDVFEFDLEKEFCLIIPARMQGPLVNSIPIHFKVAELTKKSLWFCRYLAFLFAVTILGESELI